MLFNRKRIINVLALVVVLGESFSVVNSFSASPIKSKINSQRSLTHVAAKDGNNNDHDELTTSSRRQMLTNTMKVISGGIVVLASPAWSESDSSGALVTAFPGLEYLEPIFELKLSVDTLAKGTKNVKLRPYILKRLDKFFKEGPNERTKYSDLGVQYVSNIEYNNGEGDAIQFDREQRLQLMESTLQSLEKLKQALSEDINNDDLVINSAQAASDYLQKWFDMIPSKDLDDVDQLFKSTRGADANRDGKLDTKELATLTEEQREVWKKRVKLYGES